MDRVDFFFRQLLSEAELDEAFDQAQDAINERTSSLSGGLTGIISGLNLVESDPPSMSMYVSSGVAYDPQGRRMARTSDTGVSLATDWDGATTTVSAPGNFRWVSVFAKFEYELSDPRADGTGAVVQYHRSRHMTMLVVASGEGVSPTRPPLRDDARLVGEVLLAFGTASVATADVDVSRREDLVRIARVAGPLSLADFAATDFPSAFSTLFDRMASVDGAVGIGADLIGAEAVAGDAPLAEGTVGSQLSELSGYIADWPDQDLLPGTDATYDIGSDVPDDVLRWKDLHLSGHAYAVDVSISDALYFTQTAGVQLIYRQNLAFAMSAMGIGLRIVGSDGSISPLIAYSDRVKFDVDALPTSGENLGSTSYRWGTLYSNLLDVLPLADTLVGSGWLAANVVDGGTGWTRIRRTYTTGDKTQGGFEFDVVGSGGYPADWSSLFEMAIDGDGVSKVVSGRMYLSASSALRFTSAGTAYLHRYTPLSVRSTVPFAAKIEGSDGTKTYWTAGGAVLTDEGGDTLRVADLAPSVAGDNIGGTSAADRFGIFYGAGVNVAAHSGALLFSGYGAAPPSVSRYAYIDRDDGSSPDEDLAIMVRVGSGVREVASFEWNGGYAELIAQGLLLSDAYRWVNEDDFKHLTMDLGPHAFKSTSQINLPAVPSISSLGQVEPYLNDVRDYLLLLPHMSSAGLEFIIPAGNLELVEAGLSLPVGSYIESVKLMKSSGTATTDFALYRKAYSDAGAGTQLGITASGTGTGDLTIPLAGDGHQVETGYHYYVRVGKDTNDAAYLDGVRVTAWHRYPLVGNYTL